MAQSSRSRGFTLIELLVVVAIISLLISILLPSLTAARNVARMVRCEANLKQYGTAHQMYANESEDWFTPHRVKNYSRQWIANIKYRTMLSMRPGWRIPEGLACPNSPEDDRKTIPSHNYGGNGQTHGTGVNAPKVEQLAYADGDYATGQSTTGTNNGVRHHRGKILRPSEVTQVMDASDWNCNKWRADYRSNWDITPELNGGGGTWGGGTWNNTAYRHSESAKFLRFDGHAESKAKTEAFPLNSSGGINWGPINRLWEPYRKR